MTPKELGEMVDRFKVVETWRLQADKEAEALKRDEVSLKLMIIAALKEMEISSIGGTEYKVERLVHSEPVIKDWQAFTDHIHDTGDFSLLERRPGRAAIKERWADGKEVPGIEPFPVDKLSFTKLKG